MARRNALREWLDQTKKLAKSKDYACLNLIDQIFSVIWYIDKSIILEHRAIFDDVCGRYHKPNPVDVIKDRRAKTDYFSGIQKPAKGVRGKMADICPPKGCPVEREPKGCPLTKHGVTLLNNFVQSSILAAEEGQKEILWQWFEIIDFMFERPELIHPKSIDEYVEERINFVCKTYRKNNPLQNGIRKKFGKEWRDEKGQWHLERRERF